ncbi:MAG: hypothetical protein IT373_16845 [Polyangiaceae bacterium]|nr:hypothetical protein [Polyangiaceae bacterium]
MARFDTPPGEAFCGQITLASAYRDGFSPRVQARLRLDAQKLESGEAPGTVTTFDGGAVGAAERLLDEAALRPIEPLAHDALSELEFGDGRERNFIYAATPAASDAEALLAFLSLRTDGRVELRLLRAGREGTDVPAGRGPVFGLFLLDRVDGDCGF